MFVIPASEPESFFVILSVVEGSIKLPFFINYVQ